MAYIREYPPPPPSGILPVVWGPFNSSRVGISSITQIKKMQIREECINSLETSSDRIWNENVSLRQIKKKIEYSKKHNLKINTTCYVWFTLHNFGACFMHNMYQQSELYRKTKPRKIASQFTVWFVCVSTANCRRGNAQSRRQALILILRPRRL